MYIAIRSNLISVQLNCSKIAYSAQSGKQPWFASLLDSKQSISTTLQELDFKQRGIHLSTSFPNAYTPKATNNNVKAEVFIFWEIPHEILTSKTYFVFGICNQYCGVKLTVTQRHGMYFI
ncbi:uncharacterized protein ZBIST_2539 [Zygosaccharomyces bailii]|nr:uncharacterized protein ZBAI_00200 [Zygosaccharomyces bailii ISA1307]SJM85899.1 uncharacterized protein ZBIST_2539 [Zygosaccharomyces bailii]